MKIISVERSTVPVFFAASLYAVTIGNDCNDHFSTSLFVHNDFGDLVPWKRVSLFHEMINMRQVHH